MAGQLKILAIATLLGIPLRVGAEASNAHPLKKPAPHAPFDVSLWVPLEGRVTVDPSKELDLRTEMGATEDLVVYGQRRHRSDAIENAPAPVVLGPVMLTGSTETDLPGFRGMRVTAAIPIPGEAGLSAVADLSAGHDQVNSSTTAASAAATVGLKLAF